MSIVAPRLLPVTTVAIAALLAMKGLELVRAATPADALGQVAATQAAGGTQSAASPIAQPAAPPGARPAGVPSAVPSAAAPAAPPPAPAISNSEKAVLQELRQRRQELDAREQTVAAREAVLAAAERKVGQRVAELQALQQKLEALEAARKQRQDASWEGLVKLYSSMKPRDAAKIFDDLEMPVLLEVMDRMNDRKAAPIVAAMQPDRARELTAKLAALRLKRDSIGGS